jgi:hypothetical protein
VVLAATIAVMYVDIRCVGSKLHRAGTLAQVLGLGGGELEMTAQCDGAVTVNVNTDLRSGCSKVVKTRRASGTSNWL